MERVRAVIIKDGKILLINRVKEEESYWVIPGGGVEGEENHNEAISRECKEELGVDVVVEELIIDRISEKPQIFGQTEFFYNCNIVGGRVGSGDGPEFSPGSGYEGKHIVRWVDMEKLQSIDLRPSLVKEMIIRGYSS